ncbi:hypothetical protein ON010_g8067 [Phytophthora cinnamomi]|nr:hypothetical protein ON010_g8067 [Phytophthora cinnamomi]
MLLLCSTAFLVLVDIHASYTVHYLVDPVKPQASPPEQGSSLRGVNPPGSSVCKTSIDGSDDDDLCYHFHVAENSRWPATATAITTSSTSLKIVLKELVLLCPGPRAILLLV